MDPGRLGTRISIDPSSRIPPFEQLRGQLALMVASGRLRPGGRLPTVRGLAGALGLSNGTVARAYRELDYAGIIVGRGRRGTFVADAPPNTYSSIEQRRHLDHAARVFAMTAHQLAVDDDVAVEAVRAALSEPPTGAS